MVDVLRTSVIVTHIANNTFVSIPYSYVSNPTCAVLVAVCLFAIPSKCPSLDERVHPGGRWNTDARTHASTHARTHARTHTQINKTNTQTHKHTDARTCKQTHKNPNTHARANTHKHTFTHTSKTHT